MTSAPNICVYTVLLGNYEALNEQPMARQSQLPFICLTDDPDLKSDSWQIVQITPALPMDPIRSQRLLKLCPHNVPALQAFDRSLYIDNSVLLTQPPEAVIERYGWGDGFSLPNHSYRDNVMDEFLEVARLGFDEQTRIFEQLNHYLLGGDPSLAQRPHWTAILLRDHANPQLRQAMECWALHVMRYSRRDQLSFNAAMHASAYAPQRWDIDNRQSWFHSWPHMPRRDRLAGPRNPLNSLSPLPAQLRMQAQELQGAQQALQSAQQEVQSGQQSLQGVQQELAGLQQTLQTTQQELQTLQQAQQAALLEADRLRTALAQADAARDLAQREADGLTLSLLARLPLLTATPDGLDGRPTLAHFEALLQERERALAEMHASTSWRVTQPLRKVKDWLR